MYDVDENGFIDLNEMTKLVRSIYQVSGVQQQQVTKSVNNVHHYHYFCLRDRVSLQTTEL